MSHFLDLTLSGVTHGAVYAAAALSLVLIWRATRILNFALPAMAMLTTYLAYTLLRHGASYWLAAAAALVAGLLLGAVVERVVIRPVEKAPPLNAVIVALGLLVLLEAVAGMIYGGDTKAFPTALNDRGYRIGRHTVAFTPNDAFTVAAVVVVLVALLVLFRRTDIGLRMRAAAFEQEIARLLGVRVGRVLTLGWALASVAGSLVGLLVAPSAFLSPGFLEPTLVFGFTAAVLGGLDSPPGAVVGGLVIGLVDSYVAGYLGDDLTTVAALAVLVATLMVRPSGLFAAARVRRV